MNLLSRLSTSLRISIVLVVIFLLRGNELSATWFNNLGSRLLLSEWQMVNKEMGLPQCEQRLDRVAAATWVWKSLALDPKNERYWLQIGRVYWLTGKCEQATSAWRQAVDLSPTDAIARLELTIATYVSNADADFVSKVGSPDIAIYFQKLGLWASESDFSEVAIDWYEFSMAVEPSWIAADGLSRLYISRGEYDRACNVWQRLVIATAENTGDHWWALGQIADLERDWELAANAYQRGAGLVEKPYRFYMEQGRSLQCLHKWEDAKEAYLRALALQPDSHWPMQALGQVCFGQGRDAEARKWLEQAMALKPDDALSAYYLAQVLYRVGEVERAVRTMTQAVELHPGEPWEWVMQLGDWRRELGDLDGALVAYEQALAWAPEEEGVYERIDQMVGSDD